MPKKEELTAREIARQKMQKMTKDKQRTKVFTNKFFITFSVIFIIVAFVATVFTIGQQQQKAVNESMAPVANLTPKNVDANGAFRAKQASGVKLKEDSVRVDLFFDPQCPGCGALDRAIGPELTELSKEGEIDLYLSPVSFLDNAGRDRYSSRAANAVITVAEESPENLGEFVNAIYEEDFQPAEGGGETRSDEELIAEAVNVGVSQESAEKIKNHSYFKWIEENTEKQTNRKDLFSAGFSTPSIFLNVSYNENNEAQGFKKLDFSNGSIQEVFTKELNEAKEGK